MPELVIVVGPNGSGKSSAVYETGVDQSIVFINPDDIARTEYASVPDEDERNALAWASCNAQRDALLAEGVTFGFETVGSHPSKVEFMERAKRLGYRVTLLFVSTEDSDINLRRIAQRQLKGGHGVPEEKVRSRYLRTMDLLKDYFRVADEAFVWDNSRETQEGGPFGMRELVRKTPHGVEVLDAAYEVQWVQKYLLPYL